MTDVLNEGTRNEQMTIGTTSVSVSSKNANRRVIYLRNASASATAVITINFGNNAAVASKGIVMNKDQHISDSDSAGYFCYRGEITAICNEAAATLAIFERTY